ncbi:MAG: FHA domain-containing protein [Myxococcota bacterium]
MIWDFFRALGQGRIDNVVNTANAKKAGVLTKAKTGAAKQFNKAVDAPGKAVKGAVKGGKKDEKPKEKAKGGDMGWFSKKRSEPERQDSRGGGGDYAEPEKTVAIDLNQINRGTFKPVVGWVVVMNGELRGRDFRLVDGKNVMGTAADCDVVLTDPYLSSKHAVIRHENGVFTLVDLDSTNGTYLNERRVSKEDLIDNDKVRLGRSEMKFKSVE